MWKPKNSRLAVLALALAWSPLAWSGESLHQMLREAGKGGRYLEPAQEELVRAEKLFARTLASGSDAALEREWAGIGFELLRIGDKTGTLLVLRENPARKEGRGFYVFRAGSSGKTAWQAPHSNDDEHTGKIVLSLFEQGRYAAAAWNTVSRRHQENGLTVDADLAHLPASHFLAFSRAFAQRFGDGTLVQLHGFAQSKRRSDAGSDADLILSAGDRSPPPALLEIGNCLKSALPYQIRIFPLDINELGATTNIIGQTLRQGGHSGFVHIETSAALRAELLNKSERRAQLIRCLPR